MAAIYSIKGFGGSCKVWDKLLEGLSQVGKTPPVTPKEAATVVSPVSEDLSALGDVFFRKGKPFEAAPTDLFLNSKTGVWEVTPLP